MIFINWFGEKDFKVDVFTEVRENKNLNETAKE
jgi:hypothetical protein